MECCLTAQHHYQGPDSIQRCHLTSIGNPIVEIRQSYDRLISTLGFPILVRWYLFIESGPRIHIDLSSMGYCEIRNQFCHKCLTHWGCMTHICVSKLTITGSDNGLSTGRRQALIWTYAGILLTGPLGKNFSEILIKIYNELTWQWVNLTTWRQSYLPLLQLNSKSNENCHH